MPGDFLIFLVHLCRFSVPFFPTMGFIIELFAMAVMAEKLFNNSLNLNSHHYQGESLWLPTVKKPRF